MSQRKGKEQVEAIWREKLNDAEHQFHGAIEYAKKIQSEYPSLPPSDGNLLLERALKFQNEAMNHYARVLDTFTRFVLYGEPPEELAASPLQPGEAKPETDSEVQEWVFKHHDFVPPVEWIAHCRELYLGMPPAERSGECPLEKRKPIREAFVALGLLTE